MAQATEAQTVDTAWLEEFIPRWAAAWNSHQPERVLELMTDDIVYDDSAWPETMRGKAAVREFLDHTWRAFPDLTFEPVGGPLVASDGPRAAAWWRGSATNTGPIDPPGVPPTGRRLEFEGADFHEYRDGKVARLRIVFDMADAGRQLGLLPHRGSGGERLMVWMQRLKARATRR
jgi:steroid delta-isomerase-like uncharacterized protein